MCDRVLSNLRRDHEHFERFFKAIEHECKTAESGQKCNRPRLAAITAYLEDHALPRHHALEDAMFFNIVKNMPRFRQDVYDLPDDHESSKREFQIFASSVALANDRFSEAARSFVENERGHFIAEEEILFPYAMKTLTEEQWAMLEQSVAILDREKQPTSGLGPISDLLEA